MSHALPTFLGLGPAASDSAPARYAVLPVPYEGTVSYAPGTAGGPAAILDASQQVELFDEELHVAYADAGVATLPAVAPADEPAEQMRRVRQAAQPMVEAGTFLLTVGGEHSITAPLVAACAERYGPLSVLQVDAPADLRDTYDGSKHSHACVMSRVLETTESICQVGIRSYSEAEYRAHPRRIEQAFTPRRIADDAGWIDRALERLGETVYITVDMDGLDPSIAPGVGTPEPGGLSWAQVTSLLRRTCAQRRVVGADVVEVRPIPPSHVTEFVAARLACKIIAYTQFPAGRVSAGDVRNPPRAGGGT